jgi:hypothetical protein
MSILYFMRYFENVSSLPKFCFDLIQMRSISIHNVMYTIFWDITNVYVIIKLYYDLLLYVFKQVEYI